MQVSQRFHNDTYAPGIATYGIPGKPGESGNPGTCMFFTDFEIINDEFLTFVQKITSRMIPIKNKEIVLNRKYINGDLFVTKKGLIYMLKNITELSTISMNGEQTINPENYLEYIGQFDKDENDIFYNQNDDIRLNTLTITENEEYTSGDGLLNINKINPGNGEIVFIDMNSLYGSAGNQELKISYDNKLKAFKLSSKFPIIIDSNLYVNQNTATTQQISNYSPVLTNNNNITNFYGICNNITYDLDASIYIYTKPDSSTIYYGSIYVITLNDSLENKDKMVLNTLIDTSVMLHFQNKSFQDFQLFRNAENTYYFKQNYDFVKLNDIINKIRYVELNDIQLSLIYNIEVYLTKENTNLVGFKTN